VDPVRLVARDAARRWARFPSTLVPSATTPAGACDLCGGAWRPLVYATEGEWPACHAVFERHKYLSPSGELIKFVGFPPYGEAPLARGQLLAEAGFGPAVRQYAPGYLAQSWIPGRPLPAKADRRLLARVLEYLVFRSATCRAESASLALLELMLRLNVKEALGLELPDDFGLELVRPVYADARLSPHEWIQSRSGELLKVDATDHGDDQFFPGPCDSAWDVAGVVIEWQLDAVEAATFCEQYRRGTRDDVAARLGPYLVAYAAFALARAQLAALRASPAEKPRLEHDGQRYLGALAESVERSRLFRRRVPLCAHFDRAS
jgi:hypothetical protein